MSKNNHTNPRPKLIEFKMNPAPNIRAAHVDLEHEILSLELAALLLHGGTDYSVKTIPYQEQWRGLYEQDTPYILKRIQAALGKNGIVATRGNISDALRRISRRFEDGDILTARQFSPFSMAYWVEKAKESPDHWEKLKKRKKA